MSALRRWMGALGLCALAVWGCAQDTPHLLELSGLQPPAAEAGDELTLSGDGFVERGTARVVFTGELTRAGFDAQTTSIDLETVAVSTSALEVELDAPLVDAFLGSDRAVRHATFRGEISVAFAPRTPGAPPVMGMLKNVVLDLFRGDPSPMPDEASTRLVRRFGWELTPNSAGEMCVKTLAEASEPGPLLAGDCVLRFGSLNVFGVADLAPIAFKERVPLLIRRDGALAPQLVELDVSDLQAPNPSLWRWALGLVGIFVLVVLVCATPVATALSVVEASVRRRRVRSEPKAAVRHWGLAPFLVVSVVFGAAHVGLLRAVGDFDVLLLYCGALPLFWLSVLIRGGGSNRWGLTSGLKSLFGSLALALSSALGLCIAVLHNASLSLNQASLAQGASPLGFFGFASPGAYLGAATLSFCALSALLMGHSSEKALGPNARLRGHVARTLAEAHAWILLGLCIVLYAGGWQLPTGYGTTPWRELAIFQGKFSLAYLLFVGLRLRVPALSEAALLPIHWRWLLPLGLGGAIVHLVWVAGQWPDWLQSATAVTLCTGSVALLALAVLRLLRPNRGEPAVATVNPWL